jgi:hypothetical protein
MAKKPNTKLARAKALQGDTDGAIALLTANAAADPMAAASLMQLQAFRGQWNEVAKLGLPLVDQLDAFDTLNVYSDSVALVAWAGVNGAPVRGAELKPRIKKGSEPPVKIALQNAIKLLADPKKNGRIFLSDSESDPKGYAEAVEEMRTSEPKLWGPKKSAELTDRLLGIARAYGEHKQAIELAKGDTSAVSFEQTVFVTEALIKKKDLKGAWSFLEPRLKDWWPLDEAEVAPVILLLNPELKRLMTPERCERVLATPRGSGA